MLKRLLVTNVDHSPPWKANNRALLPTNTVIKFSNSKSNKKLHT